MKKRQGKYDIGDIVFVNEFEYDNEEKGVNHLFVVVGDDERVIPIEYFGLIVSSHIEKSKFKYNEIIKHNSKNSLSKDSIIKCDKLYVFKKANILFKIGNVDVDDYMRFMESYEQYLKEQQQNV